MRVQAGQGICTCFGVCSHALLQRLQHDDQADWCCKPRDPESYFPLANVDMFSHGRQAATSLALNIFHTH